jgi:protein-S-isoprenylcysteine O-methyltransferase Ste14
MKLKLNPASGAVFGTLFFLLLILPVFLIAIPYKIVSSPNHVLLFDIGPWRYFGWAPIVLGVAVYIWCSHSFSFQGKGTPIPLTPTRELVVSGLYRYVRNPMYIAGFMVLGGETVLFQSKGMLVYFLIMLAGLNFQVLCFEEPYLEEKFGESFRSYRRAVRRWIPRLTPYRKDDPADAASTARNARKRTPPVP